MTKYLMCTYVPNMKFLCLILWLGEVCTDTNDTDANDFDANDTDTHACIRLLG